MRANYEKIKLKKEKIERSHPEECVCICFFLYFKVSGLLNSNPLYQTVHFALFNNFQVRFAKTNI